MWAPETRDGAVASGAVSLRVSVTERCDLRCRYCRTGRERTPAEWDLPSLDRLAEAVGWAVRRLGVTRVKITGGEPLLRPGVVELVRDLGGRPASTRSP